MKKTVRSHRFQFLFLALAAVLVVVSGFYFWPSRPSAPKPLAPITLRLPVDTWPGNFWILVGDANGYFRDEGITAELIDISDSYIESMGELAKGKLDTYLMTFFDLIKLNLEGADLVAVFQSDISSGGEGILAKEGNAQLSDLKGKRIGVEAGTYLDYFLETSMIANDVDPDSFTKVDFNTDDLGDHYGANELDSIVIWEPDLSDIAKLYGGKIIFDTSKIEGFSMNVFAFRRDFLKNRPDDVGRLLKVWKRASDFIRADKDATVAVVSRYPFRINSGSPYSTQEIEDLLAKDNPSTLDDNLLGFSIPSGYDSIYGNAQYALRFFQRRGAKVNPSDVYKMIDRRFIQELQKTN